MCGHATLASAHVFFNHRGYQKDIIVFHSKSGPLSVSKEGDFLKLDFPTDLIELVEAQPDLERALNIKAREIYKGKTDFLCILDTEKEVQNCNPDFVLLRKLKVRGIIVSAKGDKVDFVSRFFAPRSGVDEDSVTGSAHTSLTPYWAGKLRKTRMEALQLSARGGYLICEYNNDRTLVSGKAVTFSSGIIFLS